MHVEKFINPNGLWTIWKTARSYQQPKNRTIDNFKQAVYHIPAQALIIKIIYRNA